MGEDKFTAVIVGAGPAGSTAAYLLAQSGVEVLLIERSEAPGGKNMFGGRMYSYALQQIIPNFWEEAPLERPVVKEFLTLMHGQRSLAINTHDPGWLQPYGQSYTVLRAEFDAWLANKAEEAGAMLACGIRVDEVLLDNGRVIGVKAGDDELRADVVILADGANSLLTERAGLRQIPLPSQVGTGVKQLIELPEDIISQRFGLEGDQGAAGLFVGSCTAGLQGGGFLYTNRNSLSLGLVVNVEALQQHQLKVSDLLEDFKTHPAVAPLIAGGRVLEYSGHLVPEAGINMQVELFRDGILVAGDAAGLVINLGYMVRGVDLAILSGAAAAQTVIAAHAKQDFSKASLSTYLDLLRQNGTWAVMETYRGAPHFLDTRRIYEDYPQLATQIAADLFSIKPGEPQHLMGMIMDDLKKSPLRWRDLAGDLWKGGRTL